jgi:multiple sugar transport system substrate-binding protein
LGLIKEVRIFRASKTKKLFKKTIRMLTIMQDKKSSKQVLQSLILCACLFVLFLNAGCGMKKTEHLEEGVTLVKVAFWGTPEDIGIITQCIRDWQEDNPHIKVDFQHTPYTGYVQKIMTRIAGNVAPDIICTEVNSFVSFQTNGVLENLTPFIQSDPTFSIQDFFPEVTDRFTRETNVYAIPRDTAPFACVYYNKDLFDQEGVPYPTEDWTWDDMLTKAQALTKRDEKNRIKTWGFYGWAWQNFIYGNGANLVDDTRNPQKSVLDDPLAIEGLQFYADLINKHKVMPTPVALSNVGMGVDHMFASGRLAMFLSGIWETPSLRNYDFNWDVVMFPKNNRGIRRFGTGGSGYAMLQSCENKDAAWEVLKALTSVQAQIRLANSGLAQPARRAVAEGEYFAKDGRHPKNKAMLNKAVKYVVYDPFHKDWPEAESKYINPTLDLIKNGKEPASEALLKIVPHINELLQRDQ